VSSRPSPVLVTGAAGFAGSHLVELLAGERANVVAWAHAGGHPPTATPGVRWQAIDLLDRAAVRRAISSVGPVAVYHCAGAAHVGNSWGSTEATLKLNVLGTHHLLEALRLERQRCRVLVPSSAMVYRPAQEALTEEHPLVPPSPYGLSKLAQEQLALRASDDLVQITIARAFNHVGPRQNPAFAAAGFARQIAEIETGHAVGEVVVGNLEARRDALDVRDTVRAYRTILERGEPARVYNVSSGTAMAIGAVLEALIARARVPISIRVDPGRFRPNDLPLLLGDPRRLRDELDWSPQIPLSRTLDDLLEYWRRIVRLRARAHAHP
jgi:GDP-4-dehydro-6-deoxy-D-mannose reductase